METILNCVIISGEIDGKPYKGGRLLVGSVKGDKLAFVKLRKCSVQLAETLRGASFPIDGMTLLYDSFGNVAEIHKAK